MRVPFNINIGRLKIKCLECNEELKLVIAEDGKQMCSKCSKVFTDWEVKEIKEIEMMDEDLKIWKSCQKFR